MFCVLKQSLYVLGSHFTISHVKESDTCKGEYFKRILLGQLINRVREPCGNLSAVSVWLKYLQFSMVWP